MRTWKGQGGLGGSSARWLSMGGRYKRLKRCRGKVDRGGGGKRGLEERAKRRIEEG